MDVEALGGTLEIVARFPGGSVTVSQEAVRPAGGSKEGRSRVRNPRTEQWVKHDTESGRFLDIKQDGSRLKGVRREKK